MANDAPKSARTISNVISSAIQKKAETASLFQLEKEGGQALKERETDRKGKEEFYNLRRNWSWFLFSFIAVMIIFQICITVFVAFGWASFEKYNIDMKWFLYVIIGENFAQILGMGYIVVKFLFSNKHGPQRSFYPHFRQRF